jgi:hypothetical protein
MAKQHAPTESQLGELANGIIQDVEKLVSQHFDLLRSEVKQEVNQAKNAAISVGAGAGCVAVGGILGTLMAVHLLHSTTRIPLWGCYGLVGGALGAIGASLLYSGGDTLGNLTLQAPQRTVQALKDDVQWIREQATNAVT